MGQSDRSNAFAAFRLGREELSGRFELARRIAMLEDSSSKMGKI